MKKLLVVLLSLLLVFAFTACGNTADVVEPEAQEPVTLTVAAAASLEKTFVEQLIPAFQEEYNWITVEGTYDSSGKLQTQIEEGFDADVFMSAANKQMNALCDEGLILSDSVVKLLENKIVMIEPVSSPSGITSFEDITKANVIAIGDPESVPAGQYAQEALTSLGIWDEVIAKASLGTNVTEVLSWVEAASAEVGIVYATDAAGSTGVTVVAEAPEGSLEKPVIYPVGILTNSANQEAAQLFVDFLCSEEAIAIFEAAGFTSNL